MTVEPHGISRKRAEWWQGTNPGHVEAGTNDPVTRESAPLSLFFPESHAIGGQGLVQLPVETNAVVGLDGLCSSRKGCRDIFERLLRESWRLGMRRRWFLHS